MKKGKLFLAMCLLLGCVGCGTGNSAPESRPADEILTHMNTVTEVIDGSSLAETSGSVCVSEDVSGRAGHLLSRKEASVSYPFVKACGKLKANPISAFYTLVDQGLYEEAWLGWEEPDSEYGLQIHGLYHDEWLVLNELVERPLWKNLKVYRSHCDEAELIRDILETSSELSDGNDLEELILEATDEVTSPGVRAEKEEDVSYTYYVYSNDYFANILCFYIHHDEIRDEISDVEFQLLTLMYSTYREDAQVGENALNPAFTSEAQLCALIDAVEMNLTGTSVFHQETPLMDFSNMAGGAALIPSAYQIGDYTVSISHQGYTTGEIGQRSDGVKYERAELTTYRIRG